MSVEHKHGGLVYKFDMSLMERLSTADFPMSQIDVQRRMRPEIADLVRCVYISDECRRSTDGTAFQNTPISNAPRPQHC